MIQTLYETFRRWSDGGSIYILSDPHLGDDDCKLMDENWITPEEQINVINKIVNKCDTFICLGDVGDPSYLNNIKCKNRILIMGNHDRRSDYTGLFSEIYDGPLFIADKILLSHEPVIGLPWCLNIHGHDHSGIEVDPDDSTHINLAANVCGYTPVSLGAIIKSGALSKIQSIHRMTIDRQKERKSQRELINLGTNAVQNRVSEMIKTGEIKKYIKKYGKDNEDIQSQQNIE